MRVLKSLKTNRHPATPATQHTSPWARTSINAPLKESPARGPDPEHLKAVWSQTSIKAGSRGVNSLEGIADDFATLPLTIQDVKLEDGETPPPSVSAPPSRMSLHDVTRAFQQVPPSSSSSSSTPHRTPPIAPPPVVRNSSYAYGLPTSNGMRSNYPYPSPMMNHSPAPNLMYPPPMPASPVPSRMLVNGHTPLYTQQMWMPMAAPVPQNHGNMMRPMGSPYPAHLMPYPTSGTPAMYGHQPPANMQTASQQQPGGQGNHDRTVPMISPVMQHAGPAMYGSPVLMHAPVMQVPQNHGYMVQTGRPMRADNGQLSHQQHSQRPNNHEPSNYNSMTPSFVPSTW